MDEIMKILPTLTKAERRKLLAELCNDPDLLEDLHDIATLLERAGEPSRPYDEFVRELQAEGKL
ncbi:MAG: CopG family transcriptional regulator [Chloroflexi bacterium]|nr:CopG family transcriptional regulator [Chloroflexota bacterium]